jgi:hypothetical protein
MAFCKLSNYHGQVFKDMNISAPTGAFVFDAEDGCCSSFAEEQIRFLSREAVNTLANTLCRQVPITFTNVDEFSRADSSCPESGLSGTEYFYYLIVNAVGSCQSSRISIRRRRFIKFKIGCKQNY